MDAATDPALTQLLPALTILREPWIAAFFNPTTEQHLSQLEHALGNQTLTCTLRMTPSVPLPYLFARTEPAPDEKPHSTFIFAPSFTTGSTTVGFDLAQLAVPRCGTLAHSPIAPHADRSISRAVRDDARGVFLSINHGPVSTEIALSQLTATGRSISFIRMNTSMYKELIGLLGVPHRRAMRTLQSGLIATMHAKDTLCGAPCAKLHPLDFATEQQNVSCYVSGFDAIAAIRRYRNDSVADGEFCFARTCMAVTRETEVVTALREWALSQAVTQCTFRVGKLCMSAVGDVQDEMEEDVGLNAFVASGNRFGKDDVVKLLAGLDGILDDALLDDGTLALRSSSTESNALFGKASVKGIVTSDDVLSSSRKFNVSLTTAAASDDMNEPREVVSTRPQAYNKAPPQRTLDVAHERDMTTPRMLPQPPDCAYVTEQILPRHAVPIAPAVEGALHRPVLSEFRWKEERRKARNRASALRSNEKKRLYVKKLKEDIAATGLMEQVLRERERMLREENRGLRVALGR